MSTFKQIPQTFLLRKTLQFWGNLVRNFDENCRDDDFFDIVGNCFDHDRAVELIQTAYSSEELKEMKGGRTRARRLDLTDSLPDIFQILWNNKPSRNKCRTVLAAIQNLILMEEEEENGKDPLNERFETICHALRLNELESDILMFAYVRDQTCFSWPVRVENREKTLFYAMALDRSYAEIAAAMTPQGKLLKFNLLDTDYDFNRRALGGYMDGTSDETIARRFYKKCDADSVLPWSFYGELAMKDGEVLKRMLAAGGGPCNILLYGAPGTGKTSFARSLANMVGRVAFEVRQGDENGGNTNAEARMIGIQMCNVQEDPAESLIIVDEADELLGGSSCGFNRFGFDFSGGKSTEKGVMN
ncbi:MAG: AAA family ATPase, partial [Kiritimatiellae bacterium]|nr:AAA family ATPase [Kiritimatiellia bacterium]